MDNTRRALMHERTKAMAAGDFKTANDLTARIAALPLKGVPPLTQRDIAKYVAGKRRGA